MTNHPAFYISPKKLDCIVETICGIDDDEFHAAEDVVPLANSCGVDFEGRNPKQELGYYLARIAIAYPHNKRIEMTLNRMRGKGRGYRCRRANLPSVT